MSTEDARVAPFSNLSATGLSASVPSVSLAQSAVTPAPENASVPSAIVVASARLEPSVSVPGPVFSIAPDIAGEIVAETPPETATSAAESVAVPVIVASARNVTDAAVMSELTVAASPAFSNTAAVALYQSPATPFFVHLPDAFHDAPDAPPFHTYSPANVSDITTFVPSAASTSA